jgi:hypothetical protein
MSFPVFVVGRYAAAALSCINGHAAAIALTML